MHTSVSSAGPLHRLATAVRAFYRACRLSCAAMFGAALSMTTRRGPSGTRQSAQADALERLSLIYARKRDLMIEREILSAERSRAQRQHKAVSGFDARLTTITHELLSIG